jgi:hypothetical protein
MQLSALQLHLLLLGWIFEFFACFCIGIRLKDRVASTIMLLLIGIHPLMPLLLQILVVIEVVLELPEVEIGEGQPNEYPNAYQSKQNAYHHERSCVDGCRLPDHHILVDCIHAFVIMGQRSRLEANRREEVFVALSSDLEDESMRPDEALLER